MTITDTMDASMTTRTLAEGGLMHNWFFLSGGASDSAVDTDQTYMGIWWFSLAWFVLLMSLMVVWVFKYRRKRGTIAPHSSSHNTPLEIAWTVIPTLCLVFIFFRGFWGYMDKVIAPGSPLELNLVGQKWNWSMLYPNGAESTETTRIGAKDVPVFYVPAETPVLLRMNSQDVMHAFWVPDFRMKQDLLPNRYTTQWFQAHAPSGLKKMPMTELEAKAGKAPYIAEIAGAPYEDHVVFCAEYCGDEHSEMAAILRVVPDDAWKKWVAFIGEGHGTLAEIGQQTWKLKCASCHTIDGGRNTGPTWKDLYGHDVKLTDGRTVKADDNYIRESILYPGKDIVAGFQNQMSIIPLKEKQIFAIIEFMKTLSSAPEAKLPTPGAEKYQPAPDAAKK